MPVLLRVPNASALRSRCPAFSSKTAAYDYDSANISPKDD